MGDERRTNFDNVGRITTQTAGYDLSTANNVVAQATYNSANQLTHVDYPSGIGNSGNGTTLDIGYDNVARTIKRDYKKAGVSFATDEVTSYSQSGKLLDQKIDGVDADSSGPNLAYDAVGRLTVGKIRDASNALHSLTYAYGTPSGCGAGYNANANKNSNRTSVTDNGSTTRYCYDNADRLISTTDTRYSSPNYDGHGNTTSLGNVTMTYDLEDRHMSSTQGSTTVTYKRDALDRIIERTEGSSVLRYSYSDNDDSPEMVMTSTNQVVDKYVSLLGGVMKNTHLDLPSTYSDKWSYPNIHGDTLAVADGGGTKQGNTFRYDPFGQPLTGTPDNASSNYDFGWLGSKQRGTEHFGTLNTIEMGQRQYVPGLGRFLETDPVAGGSANDYDYCDQDPINCFDLDGTFSLKKFAHKVASVASVVAIVPGPIGMAASAVAVAGYTASGDYKAAAVASIGLIPGGGALAAGAKGARLAKSAGRDAYSAGRVLVGATKAARSRSGNSSGAPASARAISWAGKAWTAGGRNIHASHGAGPAIGKIKGKRVYRAPARKRSGNYVANFEWRGRSNYHVERR